MMSVHLRSKRASLLLGFLTLVQGGCSKMTIEGHIVDAGGNPLEGVMVMAVSTQCHAFTGADGYFRLPCNPGTYDLSLGLNGYITTTIDQFPALERKPYDIDKHVLVRIPKEKGLLLLRDNIYMQLLPGQLKRQHGGSYGINQHKWYCLDRDTSQVNTFKPGRYQFFDNESVGWRPFKLDKDGCAYRMSPVSNTRWGVDYNEKAEYEVRELETGKSLADIVFEEGEYFIADWEQGFFTRVDGHKDRFSGYFVRVER